MASSDLKSVLGRRDVFALAFGAIIGWGWVVLSGSMIDRGGTLGSMIAVAAGAFMVSLVGLTYAELTAALPRAGGELAFTYRALGPTWSWVCGWVLILAYVSVCAFEAVALGTVCAYLFPSLKAGLLYSVAGSEVFASWVAVGIAGALVVAVVNWFGIRTSSLLQQLAVLLLLVIGGAFFVASNVTGEVSNLRPHFTSVKGVFQVMMLTPFLMVGFDVIPQAAEEIRLPAQDVGRVILLSIAMAAIWYTLVQWGVGLSLSPEAHGASELPTADAAAAAFGSRAAANALIFGGLLGIVTSWNAFFVGATRLLFSMGRAGMLPQWFARLHPARATPGGAILFVTGVSLVAPFLGRRALVWLADAGSLAVVLAYLLVALSFVVLRRREPEMPRPYSVRSWKVVGHGAVLVTFLFLLLYLPFSPSALVWPYEWAIVIIWALMGLLAYRLGAPSRRRITDSERERIILGAHARGVVTRAATESAV